MPGDGGRAAGRLSTGVGFAVGGTAVSVAVGVGDAGGSGAVR
jgi:hypothetical protein